MKKLLISATLFIGMIASAMVFSSFTASNYVSEIKGENMFVTDDGWTDWTTADITPYDRKDGGWVKSSVKSPGFSRCKVEMREWYGEKQYRICLWEKWYPVTSSPVTGYKYCFYGPNNRCYCFDM